MMEKEISGTAKSKKLNLGSAYYLFLILLLLSTMLYSYILIIKLNISGNTRIIAVILAAISFISIFSMYFILKQMLKPINYIAKYAKTISEGELNISDIIVKDKDSMGLLAKAFNDMKSNLLFFIEQTKDSILTISESVDKMSKSTETSYKGNEQVSHTMQEIASKTQEQLELVRNTVSNLEQVSKRVDNILMHIKDTQNLTMSTSSVAEDGIKNINEYAEQINVISSNLENTFDFMKKLESSIKEITGIVDFITNISDQLKMLALNASIEAARAGEAGVGFAVVAKETTNLSEAFKEGAQKISNVLKSILDNSNSVEASIKDSIINFERGNKLISNIKDVFNKINNQSDIILNRMREINQETSHINQSAKETTQLSQKLFEASNMVTSSTQEVAAVIEEGVAGLQEISDSSNKLSSMIQQIERIISKFNTNIKPVEEKSTQKLRLGVIYPCHAEFWESVKKGIMYAKRELLNKNVEIESIEIKDITVENFKKAMEDMIQDGVDGISVVGYYKEIIPLINKAAEKGIPVATFNGDLPDSKRLVFVGQNPYEAGFLAGQMMIKELEGSGRIGLITSNFAINDHQLRISGFKKAIEKVKNLNIIFEDEAHDDDEKAYKKTMDYLKKYENIDGIFIVAGGIAGVAKAVEDAGMRGKIKIICFDFIESTINFIKKGVISNSIGQDPFGQGYCPLIYLYNYIVAGQKPESEKIWTRMDIVNSENVNEILL